MTHGLLTMGSFPFSRAHAHIWSNAVTVINTGWSTYGKLASFTQVLRGTFAHIPLETQSTILASWGTRRCGERKQCGHKIK